MTPAVTGGARRLGVVVNPVAGGGRGARAGRELLDALRAAGHDATDLSGRDLQQATARARTAVATGSLDALVVVGGDGMVHLGTQAVAGTGTPLGVVAVGTGNDFATCLGLPVRDHVAAGSGLLAALAAGAERTVDAIRVTSPGRPDRWVAGAVSAGLDAAVNARANAMRHPRGPARYTLAALAEIVAFRAWAYTLHLEDVTDAADLPLTQPDGGTGARTWTGRAAMVTAANTDRIGGGIRVAPHASVDDGLLDVLVAPVLTRAGAATIFPLMFSGRHVHRRDVHLLRARAVTIAPAPPPAADLPAGTTSLPEAHGDGERLGPLPVTARAVPGAVRLLADGRP
ncbi:diacylglycerol kinase [Isoptericola sp. S6320L]|uniref:diacylglycerol/lipid kinase family protein n=1 Tax=Isoptericola sp. S6320L TaxID=2926411 RepID=UPI001FF149A4|nr:diacylglycerol kinase family protein [Isoptericola sp. S6320L]MCK0115430.1 diacylglycerol kinase [Isoptericola sp. S6320L]